MNKIKFIILCSIICLMPICSVKAVSNSDIVGTTSIKLKEGNTITINIKNANENKIEWKSSNKNMVSVNNGKITALAIGKADIIATYMNKKYIWSITVKKMFPDQKYGQVETNDGLVVGMAGRKYSNAIIYDICNRYSSNYIVFNLDKEFDYFSFEYGHVDGGLSDKCKLSIYLDGKQVWTDTDLSSDMIPRLQTMDVKNVKELIVKCELDSYESQSGGTYALGNLYFNKKELIVDIGIRKAPIFTGYKNIKEIYCKKKIDIDISTDSDGKLSYSTSNKKVAAVDNKGMVFVKGYGKAIITVKTKATKEFEAGEKKITIIIVPDKVKKFSAKSLSNGRVKFTWKKVKVKNAKCQIQASTSKDFPDEFTKVVNPCPDLQRGKFIADGLKSGKTYYFRARVVVKVSGKNYCSVWSEKKIKIR